MSSHDLDNATIDDLVDTLESIERRLKALEKQFNKLKAIAEDEGVWDSDSDSDD